jgi:GxxExxY protein
MFFDNDLLHKDITDKILNAFYKVVYPHLGYGFLEKVYENSMLIALHEMGLMIEQQYRIDVFFHGQSVGEYYADLVVENTVLVELKAALKITDEHKAQLLNYLRATPFEVGLILNFGPKPDIARRVFTNTHKTITWKAKI